MSNVVIFDPLVPWALIAALGAGMALLLAFAGYRGLLGAGLRGLGAAVLLAALANPSLQTANNTALSDIVLVVVDEAQMFAPAVSGEISEETRRLSMNAMTNLMCRGRKRGLAGIVATQRLAKLAKNVAAEASNFLMGRTFLDIDMIRAADLLGMERKQAEQIRDLDRGSFLGLGPAITRRPLSIHIGPTRTGAKTNASGLMPLPTAKPDEMEALLHTKLEDEAAIDAPEKPAGSPVPESLSRNLDILDEEPSAEPAETKAENHGPSQHDIAIDILRELAADPASTYQSSSGLYQSFLTKCRVAGAHAVGMDMEQFRREFAFAIAGIDRLESAQQDNAKRMAAAVESDIMAPYLVILRSAMEGKGSPDEDELAAAYGTSSPGRIRRLLDHLESLGLIVIREEYGGGRTVMVPGIEVQPA